MVGCDIGIRRSACMNHACPAPNSTVSRNQGGTGKALDEQFEPV